MQKLCIFAASPSDMSAERAKVETVAATLKPLADNLGIVIEVVDWRVVVPDAGRAEQNVGIGDCRVSQMAKTERDRVRLGRKRLD